MRIERLFLIMVLGINLFVSCKALPKQSQEVIIKRHSNSPDLGIIKLNLRNGNDTFSLGFDILSDYCVLHARIVNERELLIKHLRLVEHDICLLVEGSMEEDKRDGALIMRDYNGTWEVRVDIDLNHCMQEWKNLAGKAGTQELDFFIIASEAETGIDKNYSFKVSPVNLLAFLNSIELIHPNGIPR
ncbi:hypothetical protein [Candidatus Borreliella tachyglossi]|uniref:hypothetical protein n=1 Tax=Candidatus Borreliella tachyglossi TaxID=1964448 RepID=UPI0040421937